jgi:uncharacterized RmlC-like cupin family protein
MGKYDNYVRPLTFVDDGYGSLRQKVTMDSDFLGIDAVIEYGTLWCAGKIGSEPHIPHKHDFNQILYFFSANPDDMSDLGAEIELYLGEENEKYMVNCSTAVGIPAGMPHMPAEIRKMDNRIMCMTVSVAKQYSETPIEATKARFQNKPLAGFDAKYRKQFIQVPFIRKGPWSYGELNPDDSGGALGVINGRDTGFDFIIMCETLKKAPYRFGPIPDKPHVHKNPEILIFMGTDLNDITQLHGEAEIALGKEMELHTITRPTAVLVPGGLPHNPLTITKVDRPFIMTDVRPYGMEAPSRTTP